LDLIELSDPFEDLAQKMETLNPNSLLSYK